MPKKIKAGSREHDDFGTVGNFIYNLLDLKDGLDKKGTIENIQSNKEMKGANAWLLMCSILIASLGLDLNSPAVIIGAMLISPLMSPILGIGLGIGINDQFTLKVSGKHLLIAIGIALVTSTLYFSITNWLEIGKGFTDEIKGRTGPNILDAMVALIGGLAGIISSSRKDKSNAIPGVAIATALMPPLCVTGYGIAQLFDFLIGTDAYNENFVSIMFNSFFLFVLNATLVALATYFIVQLMEFPEKDFESSVEEKRSRFILYLVSFVLLGVSIFTTYEIIQDTNKMERIETFVQKELSKSQVVTKSITKNFASHQYEVRVGCMRTLNQKQKSDFNELLRSKYRVEDATISFSTPSNEELNRIEAESDQEILTVKAEIAQMGKRLDSLNTHHHEIQIQQEKNKLQKLNSIALETFDNLEYIKCYTPLDKNDPPAVIIHWKKRLPRSKKEEAEKKITNLVKTMMELDTLVLTTF